VSDRSLVAGVNALFRARETQRSNGERILADRWAHLLAERDPRVLAVRYGRFLAPPLARLIDELQTAHCVRHRAIDELLLQATREGFRQVVLLGAGYDMRRSRFSRELEAVQTWIEVDRREVLARKEARLASAVETFDSIERVACDLERDELGAALATTRLDPKSPVVFVLEGLIHYLSAERFDALLATIARGRTRVRVLLSFIESEMYANAPLTFIELVKLLREIPRLHFRRRVLAEKLAAHGLLGFRSWTLTEQIAALAPEARSRRVSLGQDVALAEGEML
jgi:methyltransferase (TIGR00027 family)